MYKKPLLALFLFSLISITIWAQTEWKPVLDKEGIKIYSSFIPGSKVKAIKAECTFKANASQVAALILDVEAAPDWVYHTKSCALLKQVSPADLYYYSEVSLPWPLQNRDFVTHLMVSQNPQTKVVVIDGVVVKGYTPEKKGIVRVTEAVGKWVITPLPAEQLSISYNIHVDPAGNLPAWLVNLFALEGPYQIMKKLKSVSQQPPYKNATLAFIKN